MTDYSMKAEMGTFQSVVPVFPHGVWIEGDRVFMGRLGDQKEPPIGGQVICSVSEGFAPFTVIDLERPRLLPADIVMLLERVVVS